MEQGIFYKRGSKSDYAGADMLPNGEDIPRIIITEIRFHETLMINGRQDKERWTAVFASNPFCDKPFLLNSTNKSRIAKAFWNTKVEDGTPCNGRINLLHNIAVRLTAETARDVANGGETMGLRVSKYPAASEEEMQQWMVSHGYAAAPAKKKVITADKVDAIVAWAKKNGLTIEGIKEKYDFGGQEVEDAVMDALSGADLPE